MTKIGNLTMITLALLLKHIDNFKNKRKVILNAGEGSWET